MIKVNRKSCFLTTGCLGDRDSRLQPDDLAVGRQSHCYSGPDEAFLPQLRVPAPPTAFLTVPSPPPSLHRAVFHSGSWGTPRLLQYPYDTAEWTGGRKDRTTSLVFFFYSIQHLHSVSFFEFPCCCLCACTQSFITLKIKPLFSPQGFRAVHWGTRGLFG